MESSTGNTILDIAPRLPHLPWLRHHVYRELDTEADSLATLALTTRESIVWSRQLVPQPVRLRANFDGGLRN